jgi:hypothetical protein
MDDFVWVIRAAEEAGYINGDQAAQLSGLWIARDISQNGPSDRELVQLAMKLNELEREENERTD